MIAELMLVGYMRFPTICLKQKEVVPISKVWIPETVQYGPCHKHIRWLEYQRIDSTFLARDGKSNV